MKKLFLSLLGISLFLQTAIASNDNLVRSVVINPPIPNATLYDAAKFSIVDVLLLRGPVIQLVLCKIDYLSEQKIIAIMNNYYRKPKSITKKLMPIITDYRNKNGRKTTTFSQALLYAVLEKGGIQTYIEEHHVVIPEWTQDFDLSLLALSIDNNIPVILRNAKNTYTCLGYDSKSLYVADMSKVTGFIDIPCLPRVERLRRAKKLSDRDKKWLAEAEEELKAGKVQTYYEDFVFNQDKKTQSAPFILKIPIDSFSGEMTIFSLPQVEFDQIISKYQYAFLLPF